MRLPSLSTVYSNLVSLLLAGQWPASIEYGELPTCENPLVRQEWRTLTTVQKDSYLAAVRCLMAAPAKWDKPSRSRFDDFQGWHILVTPVIHTTGQFLPWHRQFLHNYETALREECGYDGTQPYWNPTLDVDNTFTIVNSPIFDAEHGFGGNGAHREGYAGQFDNLTMIPGWTGGDCIQDGPFVNYTLAFGPGTLKTDHCIQRGFNTIAPAFINSSMVDVLMEMPTYEEFRIELEGTPITPLFKIHDAGHLAIGGEMVDRFSSPGDPLFYLHHANLDRTWWEWQEMDLAARLTDMSGRTDILPPYVNVTLDWDLTMGETGPSAKIADVMDIQNGHLCYEYSKPA